MVSRLLPGSDEPLVIFKELIPQKAIKGNTLQTFSGYVTKWLFLWNQHKLQKK
jgi:hypothetical protein